VAGSMQRSTEASGGVDAETLDRYADLLVGFGANVQPGQIVELRAALAGPDLDKRKLLRSIAASAYRRGARFVDPNLYDPWVRRARILHADPATIDFVPSWHSRRVLQLGELRCARIAISPVNPRGVVDGLDPDLVAREPFPFLPEYFRVIDDNTTNWTGATCATPDWAQLVHPDLHPDAALARLWEQLLHVCRLDEEDPVEAWRSRFAALERAAGWLNELRLDALHYEGPGTDLVVGLLPTSIWDGGTSTTVDGMEFAANLPSEEVYTAPDPERADGVVRATKPLVVKGGAIVKKLEIRFQGGRAVAIEAETGAEVLRGLCARDEGAARLGEVALVDRESRIGALDTVFYNTLLDENAAGHLALGSAYLETVGEEDRARVNRSAIHIDFMIGSDEVDVTGIARDGSRIPVLRRGAWHL
jgi:aminopeptidase